MFGEQTFAQLRTGLRQSIHLWEPNSTSLVCPSYYYSIIYIVNLLLLLWMCVLSRMLSAPRLIPCACIFYVIRGNKDILIWLIDWLFWSPCCNRHGWPAVKTTFFFPLLVLFCCLFVSLFGLNHKVEKVRPHRQTFLLVFSSHEVFANMELVSLGMEAWITGGQGASR